MLSLIIRHRLTISHAAMWEGRDLQVLQVTKLWLFGYGNLSFPGFYPASLTCTWRPRGRGRSMATPKKNNFKLPQLYVEKWSGRVELYYHSSVPCTCTKTKRWSIKQKSILVVEMARLVPDSKIDGKRWPTRWLLLTRQFNQATQFLKARFFCVAAEISQQFGANAPAPQPTPSWILSLDNFAPWETIPQNPLDPWRNSCHQALHSKTSI